jgi:hypothetical protein
MSETTELFKCGVCHVTKPESDYYPHNHTTCRDCARVASRARDQEQSREKAIESTQLLLSAFRRDTFRSKDAAKVVGLTTPSGIGAILLSLKKRGLIDRIGDQLYRVNVAHLTALRDAQTKYEAPDPALDVAPVAPIMLHDATHIEEVMASDPPAKSKQGLFLRAGSHQFNVLHIVDIELLPDRSVAIMLAVQETRKDGYIAPVSFVFDHDDGRLILDSIAVLRGDIPSEQIAQYESQIARAEVERNTALELASELERTLNDIRSRLRI